MARAKKKKNRGFGRDILAAALGVVAWELVVKPVARGRLYADPGTEPNGEPEQNGASNHSQDPHERAQQDEMRYLDDRVRRMEADHARAWREFGRR